MFDQYFMTLIFFFLHIRDFHRFWIEWSHSGCSLRCNGRLGERRFLRLSRMAYSHGIALHSGSPPVRWPYTRMLFPWEMWYLGTFIYLTTANIISYNFLICCCF
jgi:hypothetical protein